MVKFKTLETILGLAQNLVSQMFTFIIMYMCMWPEISEFCWHLISAMYYWFTHNYVEFPFESCVCERQNIGWLFTTNIHKKTCTWHRPGHSEDHIHVLSHIHVHVYLQNEYTNSTVQCRSHPPFTLVSSSMVGSYQ